MKMVYLQWSDIEQMCQELSNKIIEAKFQPSMIISIGRGGMIPARIVSDLLNINDVALFGIRSSN